jgi:hypothetical protein
VLLRVFRVLSLTEAVRRAHHARMLASILKSACQLQNLALGFASVEGTSSFFKQFVDIVQPLSLRRLHLFRPKTHKRHVKKLLSLTKGKLESLILDRISLCKGWDLPSFLFDNFRGTLMEVKLCCINVGRDGVYYDNTKSGAPRRCRRYVAVGVR